MVELMPDPQRPGVQYEGRDTGDARLLKHVRRADLFRLLKALGYDVTPMMAAGQLYKLVEAHDVDVFKHIDRRFLRYNPKSDLIKTVMPSDKGPQISTVTAPDVASEEIVHDHVPVFDGLPTAPETETGEISASYEDLTAGALHRLCEERKLPFKKNERKDVLCAKLRGEENP